MDLFYFLLLFILNLGSWHATWYFLLFKKDNSKWLIPAIITFIMTIRPLNSYLNDFNVTFLANVLLFMIAYLIPTILYFFKKKNKRH